MDQEGAGAAPVLEGAEESKPQAVSSRVLEGPFQTLFTAVSRAMFAEDKDLSQLILAVQKAKFEITTLGAFLGQEIMAPAIFGQILQFLEDEGRSEATKTPLLEVINQASTAFKTSLSRLSEEAIWKAFDRQGKSLNGGKMEFQLHLSLPMRYEWLSRFLLQAIQVGDRGKLTKYLYALHSALFHSLLTAYKDAYLPGSADQVPEHLALCARAHREILIDLSGLFAMVKGGKASEAIIPILAQLNLFAAVVLIEGKFNALSSIEHLNGVADQVKKFKAFLDEQPKGGSPFVQQIKQKICLTLIRTQAVVDHCLPLAAKETHVVPPTPRGAHMRQQMAQYQTPIQNKGWRKKFQNLSID